MKTAGFITAVTLFAASAQLMQANAAGATGTTQCTPVYGGGTNCTNINFSITKEVQAPNGQFVKNLNIGDARFAPGNSINFRITVTNTGNTDISQINLTDQFPQYLSFTSGAAGTYDANAKTLKFSMNTLKAGQSQQVTVTAQAADAATLPANQGITCVTNLVTGIETSTNATASDTSQACIEKMQPATTTAPTVFTVPPLKKTPPTGPEMIVIPFLGATGFIGRFLKKRSQVKK